MTADAMTIPDLAAATGVALLLLRWTLAAPFLASGWAHVTRPAERGESIGLGPGATLILGVVEVVAGAMLVLGLWVQVAAAALILVMAGALQKKIFVWKKGFFGDQGDGWYHELLYLVCSFLLLTMGGGALALG